MEKVANYGKRKVGYTKEEVKLLKDMSLTDKDVAELINRSENAVYCKRWALTKGKYRKNAGKDVVKRARKSTISTIASAEPNLSKVNRIIFGNITIDLVNKTLIVNT